MPKGNGIYRSGKNFWGLSDEKPLPKYLFGRGFMLKWFCESGQDKDFARERADDMGIEKDDAMNPERHADQKIDNKADEKRAWQKKAVLFLASQNISIFGTMLVQYAISWHITLETQSGVMMTIAIICAFVPSFFISPFAGVWADRYNRKLLIVLADSLTAITTLLLAVFFLLGYDSLWLLFAALVIRSIGTAIQTPAVGAILPLFVPEDQLNKVNGINSSIQSLVMLVSPLLSGALLSLATIVSVFFIDVVTAAIAVIIMLFFLQIRTHAKALGKQESGYFDDMYQGIKYINKHSYVRTIFIFCAIYFVLVAPLSFLTPLQVTRSFGDDYWRLTAIEVAFSVGMMLGGFFIAAWGGFKNKLHTMVLANFVIAFCTLALGIIPVFWIYLLFMVLVGFVMPLFNTPFTVLLQQKVEPDFLGRVFGVLSMISSSLMPLSMLVYGPLADAIKIEWMLLVSGFLMLILSFFMLRNKVLLEAGEPVKVQ
jgi:DHA3 family macrolide efflux protein-like MFS transporter